MHFLGSAHTLVITKIVTLRYMYIIILSPDSTITCMLERLCRNVRTAAITFLTAATISSTAYKDKSVIQNEIYKMKQSPTIVDDCMVLLTGLWGGA